MIARLSEKLYLMPKEESRIVNPCITHLYQTAWGQEVFLCLVGLADSCHNSQDPRNGCDLFRADNQDYR